MFDFISPFDALSSTAGSIKKNPLPIQPASVSSGNEDSSSWTAVSDPKRQSVDNLLEHLARGPAVQAPPPAYDSYLDSDLGQSRAAPPPLLPKPAPNRTASPRPSPPKIHAQRPPPRPVESPASQQGGHQAAAAATNRRDKESSPGPRGGYKPKGSAVNTSQPKLNKIQSTPR
jgi:hypothetical protein